MEKWKIDVAVFMNFFNRPNNLIHVFEEVKKARPSKLFLSCDGPREGRDDDLENVKKCQEIVSMIDWECEVHKNYSEKNLGCGLRMYSGISWAFEYVDKLIILEDDCVPHQDFFRFCEELLEKYKDDTRIYQMTGMNRLGIYEDTPYSYFFSGGNCCGWATWKRAWNQVDFNMGFLDDEYSMKCMESKFPYYSDMIERGKTKRKELETGRISSWTYQSGAACGLNDQICIVPKKNLITNIGADGGVHTPNGMNKIPKKARWVYYAPTYDMEFPLKHPPYVVEDCNFYKLEKERLKLNLLDKLEGVYRRIIYSEKGDLKEIIKKIPKKLGLKK